MPRSRYRQSERQTSRSSDCLTTGYGPGITGGEASLALAAGVNAMLSSQTAVKICQLAALSPVGRCQTFSSTADGYGRGEGFAVLALAAPSSAVDAPIATVLVRERSKGNLKKMNMVIENVN